MKTLADQIPIWRKPKPFLHSHCKLQFQAGFEIRAKKVQFFFTFSAGLDWKKGVIGFDFCIKTILKQNLIGNSR